MSKGERKIKIMKIVREIIIGGVCVLPSISKGDIVGKLVFIDVNPRRIPEAPISDGIF
jgi:hypothetical protein